MKSPPLVSPTNSHFFGGIEIAIPLSLRKHQLTCSDRGHSWKGAFRNCRKQRAHHVSLDIRHITHGRAGSGEHPKTTGEQNARARKTSTDELRLFRASSICALSRSSLPTDHKKKEVATYSYSCSPIWSGAAMELG